LVFAGYLQAIALRVTAEHRQWDAFRIASLFNSIDSETVTVVQFVAEVPGDVDIVVISEGEGSRFYHEVRSFLQLSGRHVAS
jgi:hypothetical protein